MRVPSACVLDSPKLESPRVSAGTCQRHILTATGRHGHVKREGFRRAAGPHEQPCDYFDKTG